MEKKNTAAEKALQKEYEQLRRNMGLKDVNEDFKNEAFMSSFHPSASRVQTVSTIGAGNDRWGNTQDVSGQLKPEEALKIAIERVLSGGAPVNNISFYDEVNWNLSKLGFPSKAPLDIKQTILGMVSGK